jgi:hypothetical protein
MTTIEFETEVCLECGITFQVPAEFSENRQNDGREFFCPNGHGQSYQAEDELEKMQAKNRELQIEVRQLKCKLMGRVGFRERLATWWKGGLR